MVYKRYIKRGGKLCGPYYYESHRDKNGKVISKFISGPTKKDELLSKINPKVNRKLRKTLHGLSFVFFIFFLVAVFFIGVIEFKNISRLTGFIFFQNISITGPLGIAYGIAVDNNGGVYVTGYKSGTSNDYYTIKYNATNGSQIWANTFDDPAGIDDYAYGIAVDNNGNVYVSGSAKLALLQNTYFYTIKYNSSGQQVWNQTYDTGLAEQSHAITVDNQDGVYVTGYSLGVYTIKYNATNGSQIWSASSSSLGTKAYGIAVDNQEGVYITGVIGSSSNDENYTTVKYNATDGSYIWNVSFDSGKQDEARAISADNNGNVYVTGFSNASYNGVYVENSSITTIKYNATNGNKIWNITNINGTGFGIDVDSNGNVYVAGNINGVHSTYFTTVISSGNFTVIKYNSTGDYQWNITGVNGSAFGIAIDSNDYAYVTGVSNNTYYTVKYENLTSSADSVYPIFSNYFDNSGTLTTSGVAWFNATIVNTNSSVFLQINGVNYSAFNSSADVYNVSVNLGSAGTYAYSWISWGNGTSKNYNISESRNYVINSASAPPPGGGGGSGPGGILNNSVNVKISNGTCIPQWSCDEWSSCQDGTQKRTCRDSACKTEEVREMVLCEGCIPEWICSGWGECVDGFYKKVCRDSYCGLNDAEEIRDCQSVDVSNETFSSGGSPFSEFPLSIFSGEKWKDFFVPTIKTCEDWSECETYYDFNSLEDIFLKSNMKRLCSFENNPNMKFFEYKECFFKKPVSIEKVYRCFKVYVEAYDLDNNLILRMELEEGVQKKLNLQFPLDNSNYCSYCYDGIRDYDEDETDCIYMNNGSCPVCKKSGEISSPETISGKAVQEIYPFDDINNRYAIFFFMIMLYLILSIILFKIIFNRKKHSNNKHQPA